MPCFGNEGNRFFKKIICNRIDFLWNSVCHRV